jgi:hypothetical protein
MEREKTECVQKNVLPISYSNLDFIRCVFLTDEQYNKNKIHIPQQSLMIEVNVYIPENTPPLPSIMTKPPIKTTMRPSPINNNPINIIENKITETVNNIYLKLNEGNDSNAIPHKIPMPIFALMGRTIEYSNSIFDNEVFPTFPKPIAIIDFLNEYINGKTATTQDKNKYKNGIANFYKFKGNVKLFIYVPYLTKDYLYVSNFFDISNSTRFFYSLISSDYFLNFQRTTNIDKKFINDLIDMGYDIKLIRPLQNALIEADKDKYLLYDDLINLCYDGGCISEIGEDLDRLVPQYTEDNDTNNDNAKKYSPFLPNKCLSKTNGYICNIEKAKSSNKPLNELLKKEAMKDIYEGLGKYNLINTLLKNKKDISEYKDEIDKYKSPIDLVYSIIKRVIKDKFSDNEKDNDKNIYAKKYSENIIKELSIIKNRHPGIPEIIMSLYKYIEDLNPDKIAYMPWGKRLLSSTYLLNLDEDFKVDTNFYSINEKYGLKFNSDGLIYVYDNSSNSTNSSNSINSSNQILYYLNRNIINNSLSMVISATGISVSYLNADNTQKSKSVFDNNLSIVNTCDNCKAPFTIILDDNNGDIIVYGNSFYDSTGQGLRDLIRNERNYMHNNMINSNNPSNIVENTRYLYCSNPQPNQRCS